MTFSGALTITDLDDFLTPSQACIIPVRNGKAQSDLTDGSTEIHIDSENNYYEVSTYSTAASGPSTTKAGLEKKVLEKAEINLNDCLACSGCITSTESLLITLQSHLEVLTFINTISNPSPADDITPPETRRPFLSISPQTLASLSAYHSALTSRPPIPLALLLRRIRSFLSQPARGGWIVGDTTFARHLSLRESVQEFEERRAYAKGKWVDRSGSAGADGGYKPGPLPVLASACPGWVCYAEKAQGDLLPLMSSVRSSQGVAGALVKQYWGGKAGLKPNEIYHVTCMPCYDKKLEASRSDFYSDAHATRDVDCVLTTGELDLLLQDLGFDPYLPSPLDSPSSPSTSSKGTASPWPDLLTPPGTSSGSYLHTLLSHISASHPRPTAIHTRKIRDSPDNEEYILYDPSTNEVLFKGAKVYGFRNLQNLVRRVGKETGLGKGKGAGKLGAAVAARRKKARTAAGEIETPATGTGTPVSGGGEELGMGLERLRAFEEKKLDYVEVMACPSGCVNGGGQMKPVAPLAVEGVEKTGGKGGMEVDEEGYPRPMPDEGVDTKIGKGEEGDEGWKWSTKEWVQRVEELYWVGEGGLITPPASDDGRDAGGAGGSARSAEGPGENGEGEGERERGAKEKEKRAAALAEEICRDVEERLGPEGRWEFLRTRFRKVVGDVLGGEGGVTLEAVKW